jgi:PAS domain S-box-containing protein
LLILVAIGLASTLGGLIYGGVRWTRLREKIAHAERIHAALEGHVQVLEEFGSEPYVMFDERGLIRALNARAETLFGFETKDLFGQSILRLIPNLHVAARRSRGLVEIQRQDGVQVTLQFRAARPEGQRTIYLFFADPGQAMHTLESDLAQVERVVGRILSQLEEPLTTINGYSELALAETMEESPVHAELENIVAASDRASRLAGVLLSFTGKQAVSLLPLDLNAMLRAMEPDIRRAVKADIVIRTDDKRAMAMVNEQGLREMTILLCVAAQPRLGSGAGRIEISVENSAHNRVLKISDNGQPLSEGALKHLFEPLYLNREELGVELSPVYGLAKQWGGEVRVSSSLGNGTVFELLLPAVS